MDKFVRVSDVIDWFRPYGHMDQQIPFETLVTDLRDSIPAADVAQVAHGKWEEVEYNDWCEEVGIKCCVCGDEWVTLDGEKPELHNFNYCPNCGAKMDGGESHG